MENVQPLNTVGGEDLLQMHLPPQQFIVEGLLPVGLAMIVGATKTGKSFLTLQPFFLHKIKKEMPYTIKHINGIRSEHTKVYDISILHIRNTMI